jgi:hypothetical protein
LPDKYKTIGRQLAVGDPKSIASAVTSEPGLRDAIFEGVSKQVTREIAGLCSKSNPSLLRSTSKEQLIAFSWEKLHEEMKERAPMFLQFLNASISNPSQSRNINKRTETLLAPMLNAGSELVSIFNEDMNAVRKIKSIILKKGGLKKVSFIRLSPLYVCMGYKSTNKMLEDFGKDFDAQLKEWKKEVENGVSKENELMSNVESLETQNESETRVEEAKLELRKHRAEMHPGYSFTGDNVDMRVLPRHMTLKSKIKVRFKIFYLQL